MDRFHDILIKHWGYNAFRPLQLDIIRSVAAGHDTLGLMPTGGGKSLTFQVPALAMEGVCVVVTPLIALMKDQVENLKRREIPAAAIYSGMPHDDILRTLENCVFGAYKFLYVSPERLATVLFLEKLKHVQVCMLAIDESHCISQWGYDFRPSYLKIAEIRKHIPHVPVLALTATATPEVVDDIQKKLDFKAPNVFQKSFLRTNLAYVVRTTESKDETMLRILEKVQGTSIVYVRNRKKTHEVAEFLVRNGISAEHFHAGLSGDTKDARQMRWKNGETRVIVSTNAFGMGIDKSEVRTVIHLDLPDSIEAYFQEAGRAGRDEKKAYAVLLYNNSDSTKLKKRISDTFPPKEVLVKTYDNLCDYYELGVGSGLDKTFTFDIADFCSRFKLPVLITYNALKLLQQAGFVELTDEQDNSSRVLFVGNKEHLYAQQHNAAQEQLIHVLLRSYTGLFTDPAYINEDLLAKRLNLTRDEVYNRLVELNQLGIIQYIPRKRTPFVTFIHERIDAKFLNFSKDDYEIRKDRYVKRIESVLNYATSTTQCRSRMLLMYFGEHNTLECGQCDYCLQANENRLDEKEFEAIKNKVFELLKEQSLSIQEIQKQVPYQQRKVTQSIRFMVDNHEIKQSPSFKYFL